jgi:hypothetical protein
MPTLVPPGDLVSLLAAAQLDARDARASQSKSSAQSASAKRDESLEKARDAEKAAAEAEQAAEEASHKSSWLKKVGLAAGVVAAAASVVVSGGSAAPVVLALAGLALSASSETIGHELGENWGKVAMWGGLACSVAGSCWNVGELLSQGGTIAASKSSVEVAARMTGAAADGGAAAYEASSKSHEADASDRHADALADRTTAKALQRDVEQMIELLRTAEKSARRGMQAVMNMSKEIEATHTLMSSSIGKAVRA